MTTDVCLLCKGSVPLVERPENVSECSKTPFRSIIENVLDRYLPLLNSELCLCDNCVALLNELDVTQNRCKVIKDCIISYCIGFDVQPKRIESFSQTEESALNELYQVRESTNEISDDIEFEFIDVEDADKYENQNNVAAGKFVCHICNETFVTQEEMIVHFKKLHHLTIKKTVRQSNTESNLKKINNIVTIKKLQSGHVLSNPIIVGDICLNEYSDDQHNTNQDSVKIFVAPSKCKKTMNTVLTTSKLKQTIKRPIIINNICIKNNVVGVTRDTEHTQITLNNGPHFKCKTCLKTWKSEVMLEKHSCNTEQSYICEICGEVFKRKSTLELHVPTHRGIYPFVCSYCTKPFMKRIALQRHLPIHTGEIQYQCELCGKSFIHNSSFTTHMMLHAGRKNFHCNICGHAVFSKPHLERHLRVHSGEKPYPCTLCPKRFAERYNLYTHLKVHQKAMLSQKLNFNL